jgi:hypothetical protein
MCEAQMNLKEVVKKINMKILRKFACLYWILTPASGGLRKTGR